MAHDDHATCLGLSRRTFMRRAGVSAGAALLLGQNLRASSPAARVVSAPTQNRAPLAAQPYQLLPLGLVRPAGWLRRQLDIQANGMSGHLDEIWPDVGPSSGWLGGTGEAWERGVNIAMELKASSVWSLMSGSQMDRDAVHEQLTELDTYHGLPIGIFSADQHLSGRNPSQGIELCAVVETMYSLEQTLAITGDVSLADRLERIAFNALPATLTEDMWAHQYDQQPNQIQCSVAPGPWGTDRPDANIFGLEPHFGCCTANFHQGWPKLTASLWMASGEGGLAAMVYAPCEVLTRVRDVAIRVRQSTDYPFKDDVHIRIEPDAEVVVPLKLRVPGNACAARVRLNGYLTQSEPQAGFIVIGRRWRKGDRLEVAFDFGTRAVRGFNRSVSIEHGPLLFSLPIEPKWSKLSEHGPMADWEVRPTSAWNYGIEELSPLNRSEQPVSALLRRFSVSLRIGIAIAVVSILRRTFILQDVLDGALVYVDMSVTDLGVCRRILRRAFELRRVFEFEEGLLPGDSMTSSKALSRDEKWA
jgi:hypothetical protein